MSKVKLTAEKIISFIENGELAQDVKRKILSDYQVDWYNCSMKAYNLALEKAKKERKKDEEKSNVSATTNKEIRELLSLNGILADYALTLPTISMRQDFIDVNLLSKRLPSTESDIIQRIGEITMTPRIRVLQKKGRFEKLDYFKFFSTIIDAALLSYYRSNFISCYLTLIPVIEGIIIRWMGFNKSEEKPDFEKVRKFFVNSGMRQPCPHNILFHNVYVQACNKILNLHFYKPTDTAGNSHNSFNRHIASHLLDDDIQATKENCIRLFILLDVMTEIFVYESRTPDPRFNLESKDISSEIHLLSEMEVTVNKPEVITLGGK